MSDTIPLTAPLMHLDSDHIIYLADAPVAFINGDISDLSVLQVQQYLEQSHKAFQAMELFCKRVQNGEVRSHVTYNSFLHILKEVGIDV